MISIVLQDLDKQIIDAIEKELMKQVKVAIIKAVPKIDLRLKTVLYEAIFNSFETRSLLDGELRTELGIPNRMDIEIVLKRAAEMFEVSYNNTGLSICILEQTYQELLSMPESTFITAKGETLPWLEWLLIAGDRTIIRDYVVQNNPRHSRTRGVVMVKKDGGGWSIPPSYRGSPDNNFLTRALNDIDSTIEKIVEEEVTNGLS